MTRLRRFPRRKPAGASRSDSPSESLANVPAPLRKRAKRWRRSAHERSTDRRETEAALRLAKESAEQANRAKSQFLSLMSHELRTPLNSILGFAELLQGKFYGPLNEKQSNYLAQIGRSGAHLLDLINDMLDIAKIDAGVVELNLCEVRPSELVESVLHMLASQFQRKSIEVRAEVGPDAPPFLADERKCRQIMLNLLANAVKYTPDGGRVTVSASREGADGVRLAVTDSGVGIELEHQKGIFTEFFQANRSRDEALGGTGIGLALTRRLVALHHGRIGLDSTPGQGTTFWFVLPTRTRTAPPPPAKMPETAPASPLAVPNPALRDKRILIVEDNVVNQALLTTILDIHGIVSFVASSGEEALKLARAEKPDLVLTGVYLTGMDGLETTRRILSDPETAGIPIVAVTASVESDSVARCLEAGCCACLTKPIESVRLFELLRHYLTDSPSQAHSAPPPMPKGLSRKEEDRYP